MMPLGLELVACASALPFVVDTWLRTYRTLYRVRGLDRARWCQGQRAVVRDLVPLVRLAVRPPAPHTVHAWVCGSPGVLHYVYVARELRRHGIGRALVEAACGTSGVVSHMMPHDSKAPFVGFTYDPFALHDALRKAA
jgi:GNAT superfamily N-acetyltransferase